MMNYKCNALSVGKKSFRILGLLIVFLAATFGVNVSAQDAVSAAKAEVSGESLSGVKKSEEAKSDFFEKVISNELITATTYAFSVQNGVALEDMSTGTTTLVAAALDDNASAVTNIGFEFWFDGVRFTQFSVNANGLMRLGATVVTTSFDNDNATTGFDTVTNAPKIAPYYEDLCTGTNGGIRYKVVGSAPNRKLVVEWFNMQVTRGAGCAGAGTGTFQAWLFESAAATNPGVIQFVYGSGINASAAADLGATIGIQSGAATNFASVTASTDTFDYAVANNTNAAGMTAGKSYLFTPVVPAAPTGLTFGTSTITTNTLNWTDVATNEAGYVIYRSTDNVNFFFVGQTAAGATTFTDTGLTPNTNYFYRVFAVSEGALSATALTGSQTTSAGGSVTCNGAGGPWSAAGTWTGGIVPTAGDNVTITAGCTVEVDTAGAVALNVTINAGGTLQSPAAGAVLTNNLTVGGSVINNGTLDFSNNGNTSAAILTFGAGGFDVSLTGTGATTDVREIVVAKGAQATVVELNTTNFTVQGVNTDVAGYLTLTSGTFKISGTFTMTNRTFTGVAYTIPAAGGIWLNNPNYTVAAQGASATLGGLLRMTLGTFNIGILADHSLGITSLTSRVLIEGGAVNTAGRFGVAVAANVVNYTQTGGTVTTCTVGNTSTTVACFDLGTSASASTVAVMSGGTIVIQTASTAASGPRDYRMQAGTTGTNTFTGGTVQLGNAATVGAQAFDIAGVFPNLVLTNTSGANTAQFLTPVTWNNLTRNITIATGTTMNFGNFVFLFNGTTLTNNGTITHNGAASNFVFFTTGAAVLYTGTGVVTAPLNALAFQTDLGTTFDAASPGITALAVRLFIGSVTNANKITVGNGGTTTATVQIGNTTTPLAAGTFDVPMNFNPGTGGISILYLRTTTSRTTGGELPVSRTITLMTVDNNLAGYTLTLAGGNLTVTGALNLTNGVIVTNAANTLIHNGIATRAGACLITSCYVDGPLARNVAVGAYTFHVGENGYSPVLVNTTAATAGSTLTVEAFDATLAGFNPPTSVSRNWALTESGDITADLSFTYLEADTPDPNINTDEDDFRVWRREGTGNTQTFTNMCPGGPCVNTTTNVAGPVVGVTQFSRWTVANAQVPVSAAVNIGGRVSSFDGITGLPKVRVTITGGALPQPRTVTTNPFGYYNFEDIPVGTYVLTVNSKQYTFNVSSMVVTAEDNISGADFTANP